MLTLTHAISYLNTSNLPWFMDLTTFQVPMQYFYVQHRTLLPSPVLATTGCCFRFGSAFIPSGAISPLISSSILSTYRPGKFSVLSFCLFMLCKRFSRQGYWSSLPFPSPVDHMLSELFTMTHPSWVALHSLAHSWGRQGCGPCDHFDSFSMIVVFILPAPDW